MNVLILFVGVIFLFLGGVVFALAGTLLLKKEGNVRIRLKNSTQDEVSLFKRIIEGTLQKDFSQRKRLSVALGLSAERSDGEIKIYPQGRISKEALIDSFEN